MNYLSLVPLPNYNTHYNQLMMIIQQASFTASKEIAEGYVWEFSLVTLEDP